MFTKYVAGLLITGLLVTAPVGAAIARPASDPAAATATVATAGATSYDLSTEEADALAYLREEEKLAHDVYVALYDVWGESIFERIATSETRHMDAVLILLDRYGLEDPVGDSPAGVFVDPDLQRAYGDLVAQGSESLVAALEVGTLIEEMDIYDLELRLATTDNPDIVRVFENLVKGSSNHLRAFVSRLVAAGGEFVPVYLSGSRVAEILDGSTGRGATGGFAQAAGRGRIR